MTSAPPHTASASSAAPMRRYVSVLIVTLTLALAMVLALNLVLGDRGLGNLQSTHAASSWQQATQGVTYAPPVGNTRPFKVLRLADRLPQINAAVIGSSALMGITQSMFPPDLRVYNLGAIGVAAFKSAAPLNNLQHAFFDIGGAEYRCADGSLARDFDVINRGLCRGYRYDGSWTFANDRRLTPALAATLALAAAAPSSKYTRHLCVNNGAPNAELLQHLGETAQRFAARGGRMVFLLPPLAPGLEQALHKSPRWKSCLERTKSDLDAWAMQYQVTIVDAGASERYGCVPMEFSDEHHAYPEYNARILRRFFADVEAGRAGAGLYRPAGV